MTAVLHTPPPAPSRSGPDAFRFPAPVVLGNEEETGMLLRRDDTYEEPCVLLDELGRVLRSLYSVKPSESHHDGMALSSMSFFLQNGSRVYADGFIESGERFRGGPGWTNIERCTPECVSPSEVVCYVRAGEEILVALAQRFLETQHPLDPQFDEVRIHRRVVDAELRSKGCHDNYACSEELLRIDGEAVAAFLPIMAMHLATRSFVTGAGLVRVDGGFAYAQKLDAMFARPYPDVETRFILSMCNWHETDEARPTGQAGVSPTPSADRRVEIRCSDVNISDWATTLRIGMAALVLAACQEMRCVERLLAACPSRNLDVILPFAEAVNQLDLASDGSIVRQELITEAVDFQRELAVTVLEELHDELADEYLAIARAQLAFIEDFEAVLDGPGSVDDLADRADWACKLDRIQRSPHVRSVGDIESQALDLRHDHISVQRGPDGRIVTRYGYGYRTRDRAAHAFAVRDRDVARAVRVPPLHTRALLRATALRDPAVRFVDWDELHVRLDGRDFNIVMPDPRATAVRRVIESPVEARWIAPQLAGQRALFETSAYEVPEPFDEDDEDDGGD